MEKRVRGVRVASLIGGGERVERGGDAIPFLTNRRFEQGVSIYNLQTFMKRRILNCPENDLLRPKTAVLDSENSVQDFGSRDLDL